jgi:hypothetical protein
MSYTARKGNNSAFDVCAKESNGTRGYLVCSGRWKRCLVKILMRYGEKNDGYERYL